MKSKASLVLLGALTAIGLAVCLIAALSTGRPQDNERLPPEAPVSAPALEAGPEAESREKPPEVRSIGIWGTWKGRDGFTIVLTPDPDPGNDAVFRAVDGSVMLKESADAKWKHGVCKVVGQRVLIRSSTEETWAVVLTWDAGADRIYVPSGDGQTVELVRSAPLDDVDPKEAAQKQDR